MGDASTNLINKGQVSSSSLRASYPQAGKPRQCWVSTVRCGEDIHRGVYWGHHTPGSRGGGLRGVAQGVAARGCGRGCAGGLNTSEAEQMNHAVRDKRESRRCIEEIEGVSNANRVLTERV